MPVTMKESSILLLIAGAALVMTATIATVLLLEKQTPTLPQALSNTNGSDDADERSSPAMTAARLASVRRAVSVGGIIDMSIQRYYLRLRRYPASLHDLVQKPASLAPSERWDGPYINNPRLIRDPWDHAYRFSAPGKHNQSSYDLWSVGPDGADQTADDIGNW